MEYLTKSYEKGTIFGHLFLIFSGLLLLLSCLVILDLISILIAIFMIISTYALGLFGLKESWVYYFIVASNPDSSYYEVQSAAFDFFLEVIDVTSAAFTVLTEFIIKISIKWFPVLEELHLDLTWLLVDFSRIFRTVFNIMQFFVIFILTRKLKRKIRNLIKDEETNWALINQKG
jgi:hypothetical protein